MSSLFDKNYYIDKTNPNNRKIKSKKTWQAGHKIFEEGPYDIAVLSKFAETTCHNCLELARPDRKLMKCGGCGWMRYCNQTCQVSHWKKVHKIECKIIKVINSKG